MIDLSSKSVFVFDHGLFLPIAMKLSESFGKVYYHSPWEEGFPHIAKGCIGDGFEEIERIQRPLDMINKVDCWVFPDLLHSDLQLHLESMGKRVWGSRAADSIELNREKFLQILAESGLDVPKFEVVYGLSSLRHHLKDAEDKYIKISRWRGDMETTHYRNWKMDEGWLDSMAVRFGPKMKEMIRFLVFDNIETDIEIGGDCYCIDGQWPATMIHGIEAKDKAYLGAVTRTRDMPDQIQEVLRVFGPILGKYRYRNEWSMELRVKDDQSFFTDPTCRGGLPSTGSQLMLWDNFAEIIWEGSNGNLVEPKPAAMFSAECALSAKCAKGAWGVVEVPEELKPWVKLASCCLVDGAYNFPPDDSDDDDCGWLVAIGDTPQETLDHMKSLVAMLPDGLHAHIEALADIIKEVETMDEEGIEFTDKKMPQLAEVLEEK